MSSPIFLPPGFQLEQDEASGIKLPPGYELEQKTPTLDVKLPPGFQLESTPAPRIKLPPGFVLEQGIPAAHAAPRLGTQIQHPLRELGAQPTAHSEPLKLSAPLQARPTSAAPVARTSPSFSAGRTNQSDSAADTRKFFDDAYSRFFDYGHPQNSTPNIPSDAKSTIHSGDRSWANASPELIARVGASQAWNFNAPPVPGRYQTVAAQQQTATSDASPQVRPPASVKGPVDPRFPYGKKVVQTPQGPITVPLPRPPWNVISYEPDPKAYFDTTIGAPTAQVRAVRDRYENANGAYVAWTPEEKRILDKLLSIEVERAKFVENTNKYAVEPLNRAAAKTGKAFADIAEQGLYIEPFSTDPDMPSMGVLTGQPPPPALKGVVRGVAGAVGEIAGDPRNWPFFFSGGLSALARRAIARGFAVQMAKGAYDAADRVQLIWDDPNIPLDQKYEAITNSVLSALMATATARHAVRGSGPFPIGPRLLEQLNRMRPEDRQEIFSRLQTRIPPAAEIKAGDTVVLMDGTYADMLHAFPKMGVARIRMPNGTKSTVRLSGLETLPTPEQLQIQPPGPRSVIRSKKTVPDSSGLAILKRVPTFHVRATGPAADFQRKTCGPLEYEISGGGVKVRADGLDIQQGVALDAKHVHYPRKSLYVHDSRLSPETREFLTSDTVDEFRRYARVIADPNTPVRALEVIVNDPRAVPYFRQLMKRFGIPGRVVVAKE